MHKDVGMNDTVNSMNIFNCGLGTYKAPHLWYTLPEIEKINMYCNRTVSILGVVVK